jgi:putative tryptophan/tyrosine transport system substrate-binding protein
MKRRAFIALAGGAVVWPFAAHAQQAKAPARLGFLSAGSTASRTSASQIADIKEGLRQSGMIDGRDYVLEVRYAAGHYERFPDLARDLAQAGASVILVNTIAAVRAAQSLLPPLPVVMLTINDPVGSGLVASLAHPGGYTTGMATLNEDLTTKVLEFQRTIVPNAKTVAVLFNPANPTNPPMLANMQAQANTIGMTILPVVLQSPEGLDAAFSAIVAAGPNTLHLLADSGNLDLADPIAVFALEHRLPAFSTSPRFAEFGGLLAYGASLSKLFIRAAYFTKRILEGTKPADLPVEQPTQVELWINLKTAKALRLTMPASLLSLADEVIE